MVLARVPRSLHGRLRSVCRAWRDTLHAPAASPVISVRKSLRISEEWVIFLVPSSGNIIFFDPLCQCLSKPVPLHKPRAGDFADVFGTSYDQFLILESVSSDSFRHFDTASMQWHRQSYYFPMIISKHYTSWVVVDCHLYVVGGEKANTREALSRVDQYDIMSHTWQSIPNMHEGRARAAVVALQGRLCVIGGQNYETEMKIYSGEIWDGERQEWILEPQLWPQQVFDNIMPVAATVMGTLYALQSATKEFLCYDPMKKLWTSLGAIPLTEYPCRGRCDIQYSFCKQFLGVRNELWMVFQCGRGCPYRILSCVPTSQSLSLSWRVVPVTMKFHKVSTVHV